MALFSTSLWATTYQLISNGGTLNTTDFYTTLTSVSSASQEFTESDDSKTTWGYYMTFGSSRSTAYGQTANLFSYSAKTTQTSIKIYTKADNTSRKVYLQQFVEGQVPASDPGVTETFSLGAKNAAEIWTYTSNNASPRTLYFFGNNGGIMIYQIVIEETGTPFPQGGEVGYNTLLKNGRHAIKGDNTNHIIDGITYNVKSDLKPGNGGKGAVMRGATNKMKFTTSEVVVLKVFENNQKGYYLTRNGSETYDADKAITTGNGVFTLKPAGDWYIICNTSSDCQVDSISFEAFVPSTDATLSAISVGGAALDLSKFALKEGALQYDCELSYGTTEVPAVTYTLNDESATAVKTDAEDVDGTTTIVVTAEDGTTTKTYKINFSVKATLGTDATLSDIKVGGVSIAGFDASTLSYNYNIGVYADIPTVTYTLNDPNATDTYKAHNETMTDTIVVLAEDADPLHTNTYYVTFVRAAATTPTIVNANKEWDLKNKITGNLQLSGSTLPTNAQEFVYTDIPGLVFGDGFDATALVGVNVEWVYRSANKCMQNGSLKFTTSVTGRVTVTYSNTGGSNKGRWVTINGAKVGAEADGTTERTTPATAVAAGEVLISAKTDTTNFAALRFYKVTFTQTYAVNCAATTNGTLAADKSLAVAGETVTLTVTPDLGYEIASVTLNGEALVPDEGKYSFTMPAGVANVVATFSAIDYSISCNEAEHGIVSAKATANYNEVVTLTLTPSPADDYKVGTVKYNDGEDHEITPDESVYSFTMPAANVSITATFVEKADAGLSWSAASASAEIGESNSFPTLTNGNDLSVTYSSSDATVASFADNKVYSLTLNKAGETTISAIFAGNNDYKAQTVSYTLTVTGEATALDNTVEETKAVKVLENGQLIIEKNGVRYNAMGQIIR